MGLPYVDFAVNWGSCSISTLEFVSLQKNMHQLMSTFYRLLETKEHISVAHTSLSGHLEVGLLYGRFEQAEIGIESSRCVVLQYTEAS